MKCSRLLMFPILFSTPVAFAHSGQMEHNSITNGMLHPLTGLDHLIMLLGLGILISRITHSLVNHDPVRKNNSSLKIKLMLFISALASLAMGLMTGRALGDITGLEQVITASIFVVALGIWNTFYQGEPFTKRLLVLSIGLLFFHGFAHGIEMTGSLSGFGIGMLSTAAATMLVGERVSNLFASKWFGVGIAAFGIAFMTMS
ncbi:HupE/UreJ family protein [Vibrio bathopelagicus]|uniref:HupE/UreJ family protein n=1 Tax=Vibrio bathopelagicus TaxID=2777577 RepID=UPI001863A465|nr:HupE/UreJ family protein [Vibrio bathopelagicus]